MCSGKIYDNIAADPASDYGIIGHDEDRYEEGDDSEEFPARPHGGIGVNRAFPGFSADCDIGGQKRESEGENQAEVDDDK